MDASILSSHSLPLSLHCPSPTHHPFFPPFTSIHPSSLSPFIQSSDHPFIPLIHHCIHCPFK
jgi:hypothetical protein